MLESKTTGLSLPLVLKSQVDFPLNDGTWCGKGGGVSEKWPQCQILEPQDLRDSAVKSADTHRMVSVCPVQNLTPTVQEKMPEYYVRFPTAAVTSDRQPGSLTRDSRG